MPARALLIGGESVGVGWGGGVEGWGMGAGEWGECMFAFCLFETASHYVQQTDLNGIIVLPQVVGLKACTTMPVSYFHYIAVVSHSDHRGGKSQFALQFHR